MADAARNAGYTLTINTAAQVGGTRQKDDGTSRFAATLGPNGTATAGQLTITGTGH